MEMIQNDSEWQSAAGAYPGSPEIPCVYSIKAEWIYIVLKRG